MLNGCPRPEGNTAIALREMEQIFQTESVETELFQVGNRDIRGCVACNGCAKLDRCGGGPPARRNKGIKTITREESISANQ